MSRTALLPALLPALMLTGCWKGTYAELDTTTFRFEPEASGPAGWSVAPVDVGLVCPDERSAPLYLLYPDDAAAVALEEQEPLPLAILFGSGSFDFLYAPEPADPLVGTHFAEPSRLTGGWGVGQVFAALGMAADPRPEPTREVHDGRLPAALAARGYAVLLPTNCWGDLWADDRALHPNSFEADFFFRDGRAAAQWAWRLVAEPAFGEAFGVSLPIAVDPDRLVLVGLGEAGPWPRSCRPTPTPTVSPTCRSPARWWTPFDDLRPVFADPGLYASIVEGFSRLWPNDGEAGAQTGSLWASPLPDRFALVYSTADPQPLPVSIDALLERLDGEPGAVVVERSEPAHVLLNGAVDDPALLDGLLDAVLP
ncbi:MAG: hypothetical protein R3F59_26580 [Myxococcota bacterium]